MSPHCVWLVIVGGYKGREWDDDGGGLKKEGSHVLISDANRLIMIIELGKSYCNTFNYFAHFVHAFTNNFCFILRVYNPLSNSL